MLRRSLVFAAVIIGSLAFLPPPAEGDCHATAYCTSSCTLELTCPNGCPLYCANNPSPLFVTCSGSNKCIDGGDHVECDGNSQYCAPYMCSQGSNWVQCNNSGPIYCPEPYCT